MDTMSNDVIPALNLAITDINEKVITATTEERSPKMQEIQSLQKIL